MRGLFGDLFDFNHDGKLDTFERAMEYEFLEELIMSKKVGYSRKGFLGGMNHYDD